MRAAPASLDLQGLPSLRSDLSTLYHNIHKVAKDHNISSDSGDSAVAFSTSPASQRAPTNDSSSTTGTITQDKIDRLSQSPARSVESKRDSTPSVPTDDAAAAGSTSIMGQLGPAASDGERVVASPSVLKANEPFFSRPTASLRATVGTRSLGQPQQQQDASLVFEEFETQESWRSIARELKPIADVLRTDRLRSALGSSALPQECNVALQLSLKVGSSDPETCSAVLSAQTEILRVLANLCIDHDSNRGVMQSLSAASNVTHFVSQILATQPSDAEGPLFPLKVLSLLRTAIGAVLNLQLEHIPTRKALLTEKSIRTLTTVASHPRVYLPLGSTAIDPDALPSDDDLLERVKLGSTVSSWAWRVVQEVCEDEKEDKQPVGGRPSSDGSQDDDDDVENLAKSLLSQHSFGDLLRPLLHYMRIEPTAPAKSLADALRADIDDVEELAETDAEILAIVSELIEGCAVDEKEFRVSAVERRLSDVLEPSLDSASSAKAASHHSPLEFVMDFVEMSDAPAFWQADPTASSSPSSSSVAINDAELSIEALKAFAKAKAALARAVVAVSGEDANMAQLFGGSIARAESVSEAPRKDDWFIERLKRWMRYDVQARDDLVSCGMLALGNLARTDPHCLALVNEHQLAPFLATLLSPTNDIKVSHGLVSLLKNLSIPAPNKTVIGSLGVIRAVTPFLAKDKDMVQPLQFGTVGLLKLLCAGVPQNAVQVVTGPNGGDESTLTALLELVKRVDDVPTRMEATRVIVNVIKALWSSTPEGITPTIAAARQAVVRREAVQALAEMVRVSPKYPILVNEGVFALTLVGSERRGAELVSLSLLHEPLRSAATDESDMDEDTTGATEQSDRAAAAVRRRSTHDSAASAGSQPLPPPPTALDMICSVLARRDARMPPQFAVNACMLVLSLVQAQGQGSESDAEAIREVALRTSSALERLKDQGPTEALEPAARAFEAVSQLLRRTAMSQ